MVAERLMAMPRALPCLELSVIWAYPEVWGASLGEADDNPPDWLIMVAAERGRDKYGLRAQPGVVFQVLPGSGRRRVHSDVYQDIKEF